MPSPVKNRKIVSISSEPANALNSEARPKIVRLASSKGLRPTRSPIGPAESAPTMMPMLDHRKAVVKAGPRQAPGMGQGRHRDADRIDVVAVADLHQGAQARDPDLQTADPLVFQRRFGARQGRFRHFLLLPDFWGRRCPMQAHGASGRAVIGQEGADRQGRRPLGRREGGCIAASGQAARNRGSIATATTVGGTILSASPRRALAATHAGQ